MKLHKFLSRLNSISLFVKFLVLFLALSISTVQLQAQSPTTLSNVKVEELTEDQLRQLVFEIKKSGLSDAEVGTMALEQGMSPIELAKLKERINAVRKNMDDARGPVPTEKISRAVAEDSISALERRPLSDFNSIFNPLQLQNFGAQAFNNPRITFEPNLKIPTPKNYQLAADDELIIDISGYSEANYKLKVSPEGKIRIPVAGPIDVNGLSIEQAKRVITTKLSNTIYTNIKSGNTHVEVTLGNIRSIKITIIGEATVPGTYTLPSLASVYNALYACAGPNSNGSYRDIQLIRNNTTIAVVDVYQYLVDGNKKGDVRLMDQDVIKINTYVSRITLKGEVKRPGVYDVLPGEKLSTILRYAGGFTDNAYTARIQVYKNTSKDRQVTTITEDLLTGAEPQRGDTYIVGKILNRFTNRVSIRGSVYRPGEYELGENMTVSQLIKQADGLREDAFTGRATLHRLKDDLSPMLISFDIDKLLAGEIADIPLKREDRIEIFSKFDLKEGYYVSVEGQVSAPGIFLFEEGMTVNDIILLAGGLKEAATSKRIEVSRRVKDADPMIPNAKTSIIFQQDINPSLKDSSTGSFVLLPFDEITVRTAPGYFVQKNAVVEGEIVFSGRYALEAKNDRISDLIKRAGGLTPEAYVTGAVLVRTKMLSKTEQNNAEQGLSNLLKQNYQSGTSPELLKYQANKTLTKSSENVGIDLERILKNPGSEYDLLLNDGDTLRIPKQLQTVRVNGEVLYPALVRYDRDLSFKDYINGAGGFNDRSSRKRSYAVYANGSVKGTKSFLFFKNYPEMKPGAEIYVPVKRERERLRTGEVITLGATLVSMLAILTSVIRK